jgi:hypothetical protein
MKVTQIRGALPINGKCKADRGHITATERKTIKAGMQQGLLHFGTSRKEYKAESILTVEGVTLFEVKILTKLNDDWGRPYIDTSIAEVFVELAA